MRKTLYKMDPNGNMRFFTAMAVRDGYITSSGVMGGQISETHHPIGFGLQKRTLEEQIIFKMKSVLNKKRDAGWTHDKEFARNNAATNASGLVLPMKAQRIENYAHKVDWRQETFVQKKYNGHRAMYDPIAKKLYSKNGKEFTALSEILEDLERLFLDMDEKYVVDGELYCHGFSLQEISSAVKKRSFESQQIEFIIFDVVIDHPFRIRFSHLQNLFADLKLQTVKLAETTMCIGEYNYSKLRDTYMKDGYEGIMIRHGIKGYESGKRSQSVLKVKRMIDAEFKVKDILPSVDGWARLVLEVEPNGETFHCSAPGNVDEKTRVFKQKPYYIGKYVTVEFPEYSKDGIPTQPVAVAWRSKDDI